ncbi:MAG TPA: HAD family hydrolase, partial [Polyangiaceae bacterium LLY-WYZ-15_(1-7)]|nr:HAD family hydrolase [Polyangiaceae bacterium LLY-WYZ-15_(1-7)]
VRVPAKEVSQQMRYEEVPTRRVRTGEEVLHVEGEVVGVDGVVQGGEAWVLSHPGAQTPVKRVAGDPILAGARVTEGAVRLLTTRVGDERALVRVARFGHLGRGAARVVRLAEQVTRWGGMLALLGAVGGLALTGEPGLAGQISAAAAVLIAAPLLSARRSAEAPLVAAAASAAARGVVFPGPRELEDAGRVATCALSTSGTITEGRPEVVEVHVLGDDDEDALLGLAAATEGAAPRHPIGRALRRYAEGRGVRLGTVRRVMLERGRGVTASTRNGEELVLGNRQMLLDHGVSIALADEEASRAEARGHTALFLGLGGRVRAVIALRDDMRVGARAAVQRMFDQRIVVVLISGDSRATVEVLARQLDVNLVKAELLPAERGQEVKRLGESGGLVAAVGQVDDDDDVLAAADVPIILGAAGGPEGERGVALATDDVRDAAAALWMARAARSEALRGVGLAVGLGAIVVTGAALGWIVPAAAALFAVAVDAFALPAGARLLRRIELRVPAR